MREPMILSITWRMIVNHHKFWRYYFMALSDDDKNNKFIKVVKHDRSIDWLYLCYDDVISAKMISYFSLQSIPVLIKPKYNCD